MTNEKLKKAREKAGFTQKSFAEEINIKLRTYKSYERGERYPRKTNLSIICKKLNLDASVFYPVENADER
ncbi:helix-turn-helix domain-containing protein [Clostridium omnivorum]|uniref:HTH cro/C1-type domain-containing protein n=1 Tax=Clostridium omnivorum TaxID=1604902 RepID=A0ABQ5NCG2_9CLOT|nr:helix-turn-helix transcriptional regulator [Clostridium sp. E14]GLC32888.1 hypothetical protein bsdE14_42980 [Clostridium sp. E14]